MKKSPTEGAVAIFCIVVGFVVWHLFVKPFLHCTFTYCQLH